MFLTPPPSHSATITTPAAPRCCATQSETAMRRENAFARRILSVEVTLFDKRRLFPVSPVAPWNPAMAPHAPRCQTRLPHWGWFAVAIFVLAIAAVAFSSIWLPYYREC